MEGKGGQNVENKPSPSIVFANSASCSNFVTLSIMVGGFEIEKNIE